MDPVSGALTQNMDMIRGVSKWGNKRRRLLLEISLILFGG